MARLNVPNVNPNRTHEGAPAAMINAEQMLRRSAMSCLLWESEFYEDGVEIAKRIADLVSQVATDRVIDIAVEARTRGNLRHVPLWLMAHVAKTASGVPFAEGLARCIDRADEMTEFLAMYWKDNPEAPLDYQVKKALRSAVTKFDAYQLAKYNRDGKIKVRDVFRLVHPKPADEAQSALWKSVIDGTIAAPDTWEVALSGGADKKETFERLIRERKLGYMALLRNLRNMDQAGVDEDLVKQAIKARRGARRVLPFRYLAAARAAPRYEAAIDAAFKDAVAEQAPIDGKTILLVDISGSMEGKLSGKSDMTRMDAAAALAAIFPASNKRVFTFTDKCKEVPARDGMAGIDAIVKSQEHGSTRLGEAIARVTALGWADRLIVVTDEQSHDAVPTSVAIHHLYMINVASYRNGVGYGLWTHIDGFSENVIRFIREVEHPGSTESAEPDE